VKALLDEQLSREIAVRLRQAGYDVVAVAEGDDIAGSSDRVLLDMASNEGRAVVTNNIKDYRPLAAERIAQGRSHAGLILLPSTRTRTRAAVAPFTNAIEQVLRDHPDGLKDGERWIGPLSKT
jgi:hypothetical protein